MPAVPIGNIYLRKVLIHGARAAAMRIKRDRFPIGPGMNALEARAPRNVLVVAMANKLARIAWAALSSGEDYRPSASMAAHEIEAEKDASGLEALRAPTFPLDDDDFLTKVCIEQQGPRMTRFKQRQTHLRSSSDSVWPGDCAECSIGKFQIWLHLCSSRMASFASIKHRSSSLGDLAPQSLNRASAARRV
jgi:hypothetical protein